MEINNIQENNHVVESDFNNNLQELNNLHHSDMNNNDNSHNHDQQQQHENKTESTNKKLSGILKKYKKTKQTTGIQFDETNLQENEEIKKEIKNNCTLIDEPKTPYRYNNDTSDDEEMQQDINIPRMMTPEEHMDRLYSAFQRLNNNDDNNGEEEIEGDVLITTPRDDKEENMNDDDEGMEHHHIEFNKIVEHEESPEFKRKRKEHYNEYLVMKKLKDKNKKFFETNGKDYVSDDEDSSDSSKED
ncbi:hypothetical protein ABK040_014016 [Willaertia magna]